MPTACILARTRASSGAPRSVRGLQVEQRLTSIMSQWHQTAVVTQRCNAIPIVVTRWRLLPAEAEYTHGIRCNQRSYALTGLSRRISGCRWASSVGNAFGATIEPGRPGDPPADLEPASNARPDAAAMTPPISITDLVCCGVVAGVLFAVALGAVPAFLAMPPAGHVPVHQLVGAALRQDHAAPHAVQRGRRRRPGRNEPRDAGPPFRRRAAAGRGVGGRPVRRRPINRRVNALPHRLACRLAGPPTARAEPPSLRTALALLAAPANACAAVL